MLCLSSSYVSIHLSVIHLSFILLLITYNLSTYLSVYHHHLSVYIAYAIAVIKHHSLKQQKKEFLSAYDSRGLKVHNGMEDGNKW